MTKSWRANIQAGGLSFTLLCPGPPVNQKIGSAGLLLVARTRMTGNAIKRESALARFSGTTSVPQSAAYSAPPVLNVHGSAVSSPGFEPAGTVRAVSGLPHAMMIML